MAKRRTQTLIDKLLPEGILVGQVVGKRYTLEEEKGRGKNGVVYRATELVSSDGYRDQVAITR